MEHYLTVGNNDIRIYPRMDEELYTCPEIDFVICEIGVSARVQTKGNLFLPFHNSMVYQTPNPSWREFEVGNTKVTGLKAREIRYGFDESPGFFLCDKRFSVYTTRKTWEYDPLPMGLKTVCRQYDGTYVINGILITGEAPVVTEDMVHFGPFSEKIVDRKSQVYIVHQGARYAVNLDDHSVDGRPKIYSHHMGRSGRKPGVYVDRWWLVEARVNFDIGETWEYRDENPVTWIRRREIRTENCELVEEIVLGDKIWK